MIGDNKSDCTPRAVKYRMQSVGWTAAYVTLLLAIVAGCSSTMYYGLRVEEYSNSGWAIKCHIDDLSWIVPYSGDSARLALSIRDTGWTNFYQNYRPDSSMDYYILSVRVERRPPSGRAAPKGNTRAVVFDSLRITYGNYANSVAIDSLLQRHWTYANEMRSSIEPIPIRHEVKKASIEIAMHVIDDGDTSWAKEIGLTLPVVRKRQIHTFLNPWP